MRKSSKASLIQQPWLITTSMVVLVTLSVSVALANEQKPAAQKSRKFLLTYSVTVSGLRAGETVRVWLPEPTPSEDQHVVSLPGEYPASTQLNTDPVFGNRMRYFEVSAPPTGAILSTSAFVIERREVRGLPGERRGQPMTLSQVERQRFLASHAKVPLSGRPLKLLEGVKLPRQPLELGRTLYNLVDDHVKYDKSRPGYGHGDVNWVCDSRSGNCTDFHSLFISWTRAHGLPARFEIGFSLPEQRGRGEIPGYHCWAYFYVDGHGWTPVDISEADKNPHMKEYYFGHLTENRVAFTVGRDIDLVPKQSGEPLNYFIYPYVEVAGRPLPQDQVKLQVQFQDQ
jgi:transglutaminase-like putative cysteine protease